MSVESGERWQTGTNGTDVQLDDPINTLANVSFSVILAVPTKLRERAPGSM